MSMRQIFDARRATVAATAAVVLSFTVAGCGGDAPKPDASASSQSSSNEDGGGKQNDAPQEPEAVIETLKGERGIVLDVTSAVRDSGGFVTVKGIIKNTSDDEYYDTANWTGPEVDLLEGAGGGSLGGATLVDKAEKKRYYILRDTENRPLATTGIPSIKPKSETPVFMQFPAPPESTTEVDFQLPTFASTTLKLTGE